MAEVVFRDVRKCFGSNEVIPGVDLAVADREFVVFVGPSGCGKSTLLRLIAGLEDITSGDLFIDGERVNDLPPVRRGIAMVFQSYALYPHMTVYQNMSFGLSLAKAGRHEIDHRVRRAAEMLEITPLLDRRPRELSGGQRQRVAIGRAIVREPKVFLFDEPLSNLDAALRVQMRIEIARLHAETGTTTVYVTHDQVEAMTLADKIVVLQAGRIAQVGPPLEVYHRPANRFVAGFIGSPQMNFVESVVQSVEPEGLRCALPGEASVVATAEAADARPGDAVTIGIRPEHILVEAGAAKVPGKVELVEQLGESHLLHVRVGDDRLLTVRLAGSARFAAGNPIVLGIPGSACHVFRPSGAALSRRRGFS